MKRARMQRKYTLAWAAWLAWFAWVEGRAIVDKQRGDTLSEHVWLVLGTTPLLKWLTVGGLVWLTGHFITGGTGRWRKIFN